MSLQTVFTYFFEEQTPRHPMTQGMQLQPLGSCLDSVSLLGQNATVQHYQNSPSTAQAMRAGDLVKEEADLEPTRCQVSMSILLRQSLADCQHCSYHSTTVQLPFAAFDAVLQVLREDINVLQIHRNSIKCMWTLLREWYSYMRGPVVCLDSLAFHCYPLGFS